MSVSNAEMMQDFLRDFPLADGFKPVAYYDKHMDCIRVVIRDTSVTEHRVNGMFTLMEDNYPLRGAKKYVGFSIKGIRHLFENLGLQLDGVYRVTDILRKIVEHQTEGTVAMITDVILDSNEDADELSVAFSDEEAMAA